MKKDKTNDVCQFVPFITYAITEDGETSGFISNVFKLLSSLNTTVNAVANPTIIMRAENIILNNELEWNSDSDLIFLANKDIIFKSSAYLTNKGGGSIYLKSGMNSSDGTVSFENDKHPQISVRGNSKIYIFYNPQNQADEEYSHKYHNPNKYLRNVEPGEAVQSYMLVNDAKDLQDINLFLHGNYALSRDIDALETKNWNNGLGFKPIGTEKMPFSGDFEGNNFQISNLSISREEDDVGLFGMVTGFKTHNITISNLKLHNLQVRGGSYVGGISGEAEFTIFKNIEIAGNSSIEGKAIIGGLVGSASGIQVKNIEFTNNPNNIIHTSDHTGIYFGAIRDSIIHGIDKELCYNIDPYNNTLDCFGYFTNLDWQE